MKAKKGRKWTPDQKEEARFRALVDGHKELLKKILSSPERIKMLYKLATPLESGEKRSLFGSMNAEL